MLVSNTPEYCTSWECTNLLTGRALNPYDRRRTAGGSSGGEVFPTTFIHRFRARGHMLSVLARNRQIEYGPFFSCHIQGALNGCGATPFGIGSDVGGSIRVPALFNGIFGHKPTARVLSIKGHFPMSSDESFADFLVVGPMCRYAKDLPLLVQVMAGPNATQLRLNDPLSTKDIKVSEAAQRAVIERLCKRNSCAPQSIDILQSDRRLFVGRHSGAAGNIAIDADRLAALPAKWRRREGVPVRHIPRHHRMVHGQDVHHDRCAADHPIPNRSAKVSQCRR